MKHLRLLIAVLTLALLLPVALAQAEDDTVTITVNVIDETSGKPLNKAMVINHVQCHAWKDHTPENCSCFRLEAPGFGSYFYAYSGLTPCDCGETWEDMDYQLSSYNTSTATFTIKKGHKYMLFANFHYAGYDEYHVRHRQAAYIYADPVTGEVTCTPNMVKLTQTGSTTFQVAMESLALPLRVTLNATKLMDGKDPGEKQFAFRVWQLTDEQIQALNPDDFLNDDEFIEWRDEFDNMTEEEALDALYPQHLRKLIYTRMLAYLEQYPSTTVYNSGKTIPIFDYTFSSVDFNGMEHKPINYVIAEVEQPGNGACEDEALFILQSYAAPIYYIFPIQEDNAVELYPPYDVPRPIAHYIQSCIGLSVEHGLFGLAGDNEFTADDIPNLFVFRNTTCPNADPTATPVPTPAVPDTGDGTSLLLLAAAALTALMLARRLRRA